MSLNHIVKSLGLNELFRIETKYELERIAKNTEERPLQYHPWVYSCIDVIVRNMCSVPKYIYDTRTEKMIDDHIVLDRFKNANSNLFGKGFFESVAMGLLIDGQIFVLPYQKINFTLGQVPDELHVIPNKFMVAMRSKNNQVAGWKYKPDSNEEIFYTNDEVLRIWFYNPYDSTEGLAPYNAAKTAVITDGKATSYNANFFDNHAALGGVLKTPDRLKEDDAKRLSENFKKGHSGSEKAGKIAVLHSGLEFQSTTATHKEMQWKEQMEWNKSIILACFKVPKNMISDYTDQNYSNSLVAVKSFWESCVIPLNGHIDEQITYQWIAKINPYWELRSDYSGVEALQALTIDKITSFGTLVEKGIPREEAARLLNIPIDWDNVEEIESQQEDAPPPPATPTEQNEEQDTEDAEKAIKSKLNKFFTSLRNKLLDKASNGKEVSIDIEDEYTAITNELKDVYLGVIKDFIQARKVLKGDVEGITCQQIVDVLYSRSKCIRDVLQSLDAQFKECSTKEFIHQIFQEQYSRNKEIAKDEVTALYKEIVSF